MRKKLFLFGELCGVFAVYFITMGLSCLRESSDGNVLGVMFGAVNSSAWERSKLTVIAYIAVSAVELIIFQPPINSFLLSKTAGAYLLIIILNYLYFVSAAEGFSVPLIISAAALSFLCSFLITEYASVGRIVLLPSALALLFAVIMLFCFTPAPPRLSLFMDYGTGMYGLP